jgi:hypothetical protein
MGATMTKGKPNPATERIRQARLRERRKEQGWKRVTVWLTPEEAATLEPLGDDWLGRTVKAVLFEAVNKKGQPQGAAVLAYPDARQENLTLDLTPEAPAPVSDSDLMTEVDGLLAQGLTGTAIATLFNEQGRRTVKGAEYRGSNLMREWRKWKGAV